MESHSSKKHPNKSCRKYFILENRRVYFSGDFDSGNLQHVQQISPYQYRIWGGSDDPRVLSGSGKVFFHFKVAGFQMCRVRFYLPTHTLGLLTKLASVRLLLQPTSLKQISLVSFVFMEQFFFNCQFTQSQLVALLSLIQRRPIFNHSDLSIGTNLNRKLSMSPSLNRLNPPQLLRLSQNHCYVSICLQFLEDQLNQLYFEHDFQTQNSVYFAFSLPYSYTRLINYLEKVEDELFQHPLIYFHKQVLIKSLEKREVHLLTITSAQNCLPHRQPSISELFQGNRLRPHAIVSKPKVLITARVHPGQAPASYVLEGLINYLTSLTDQRAKFLCENFHFLIVPMLNPDGVAHGMYRFDTNLNNLNRYYDKATLQATPSIWALKTYVQSVGGIDFYFDLHGHASLKRFFAYGNCLPDIHLQTQNEIFLKLLEINSKGLFSYEQSIFCKRQKQIGTKSEEANKSGSGRVYMCKTYSIVHSYTIECGLHKYRPENYFALGQALLQTLLDVVGLPKCPPNQNAGNLPNLESLRRTTALKIYQSNQKFRILDPNCSKKIKGLGELVKEYYTQKINKLKLLKPQPIPLNSTFNISKRLSVNPLEEELLICQTERPKHQLQQTTIWTFESSKQLEANLNLSRPKMSNAFMTRNQEDDETRLKTKSSNSLKIKISTSQRIIQRKPPVGVRETFYQAYLQKRLSNIRGFISRQNSSRKMLLPQILKK